MSTRDRRVTLALKWHHLDNLSVEEIQDRFEAEGYGSYARSTVRGYLNDKPADEVLEQIEAEHANVRLQIAEREERMYQRAREAEAKATEDEPITAAVPKTSIVRHEEEPLRVSQWERLPPGDDRRPEWATERDTIVMFVDGDRRLQAGEEYPKGARRGGAPARAGTFPQFYQAKVGVRRDQPDHKQRAMARQEQSSHLQAKGDVLGVYSTDINMNVDGDVDHTVELDEETAAAIREATLDDE
ncbi:hypothetical protein [Haloarcula laminariae]|uniref:hypothetical protein n=1 Tax=Haloarcula laminariae TaxID=2961577 RepID=UPI00240550CF|nr:hypothetical protein [Halomicroarcula sp. FL173]